VFAEGTRCAIRSGERINVGQVKEGESESPRQGKAHCRGTGRRGQKARQKKKLKGKEEANKQQRQQNLEGRRTSKLGRGGTSTTV